MFPKFRLLLYNEIDMDVLKVGSRGSALALRQTKIVVEAIERLNPGVKCRVEVIKTTGDRISEQPGCASGQLPRSMGDKGLFVKEIEAALIAGEIDFAVHSAKDLPSEMDERLCVAAFPERECTADALVSRLGGLADLPRGAKVGTSSPRRRAQLLAARPDLEIVDMRGNLDTRLRKLDDGWCDAVVVACAGLLRMGLASRITERLPYEICLPAVGQGALAVQCRSSDPTCEIVAKLDSPQTRACVTAERALLAGLGGGCQTPIAALARILDGQLVMDALVAAVDGSSVIRKSTMGRIEDSEELGARLAEELLRSPAKELLSAARSSVWRNMGAA